MPTYFTEKTFKFLRALARNNSREWFHEHKPEYEEHLRAPFLRLITDLQPDLATISEHYRADPRATGGSLFRIHRDTRFSNDKTPYKTWSGARFSHARSKQVEAPSYYLHVQPGNCFIGAGLWHPEPESQRKIRHFIFENPGTWKAAVKSPAFARKFTMDGESLVRPPRGYPADHELIEDIKRKDFVATLGLEDAVVLGPNLRKTVATQFTALSPLVDYLCAALDLEF
ncbi:DUF2461 domain-containing protein [Arenimonas oryziterrae]|uniref:TIGR02453 family protein n=1 Tax=Arenimonas oryziterrae DSM 21050 = YC6267 TaxID=1121015 RepID=A0A091AZ94_9GAMM|nr:DUF2461 domain-containing protein [Arenimonas oryziterrae]KFN44627.1 hypothetical protein N789_01055 [Arenimonas oryziterrae DSM 21050 = YC6267]